MVFQEKLLFWYKLQVGDYLPLICCDTASCSPLKAGITGLMTRAILAWCLVCLRYHGVLCYAELRQCKTRGQVHPWGQRRVQQHQCQELPAVLHRALGGCDLATQHYLGMCQVRRLLKTRGAALSLWGGDCAAFPCSQCIGPGTQIIPGKSLSSSCREMDRAGFATFRWRFFCIRFMPFWLKSIRTLNLLRHSNSFRLLEGCMVHDCSSVKS